MNSVVNVVLDWRNLCWITAGSCQQGSSLRATPVILTFLPTGAVHLRWESLFCACQLSCRLFTGSLLPHSLLSLTPPLAAASSLFCLACLSFCKHRLTIISNIHNIQFRITFRSRIICIVDRGLPLYFGLVLISIGSCVWCGVWCATRCCGLERQHRFATTSRAA